VVGARHLVLRATAIAAILTGSLHCTLNQKGLGGGPGTGGRDGASSDGVMPVDVSDAADGPVAAEAGADLRADMAPGADGPAADAPVAPDGPMATDAAPDRAPDAAGDARDAAPDGARDAASDMGAGCDVDAGLHRCGGQCVSNMSLASCGSSCMPCPQPSSNGSASCDGTSCQFNCDPGFAPAATACLHCDGACDAAATTVTLPGGRFTGTTSGPSANAGSCGGGSAPEAVFKLTLPGTADVFVTTHGTRFDTVVYMRRGGCCGAEVACNDNADGRNTSVLAQTAVPAGTYYIFVDGASAFSAGNFTVDIYATPTSSNPADACGNPARIANQPVSGNTCGYRDDYDPLPACTLDAGSSYDAVYYFVTDSQGVVTFDTCTDTCIDSVLYVRDVCTTAASERGCDDDSCNSNANCIGTPAQSQVSANLGPGVHYLIVDTYPQNPPPALCGAYTVTPSNVPP
jgi:hypothetical protein